MTQTQFQVSLAKPLRDLEGRFLNANAQMPRLRRKELRSEARRFVILAKTEAPEGETGRFKETIRFRTTDAPDRSGFTVSAREPLSTFIRDGTAPHTITGNPYLAFFWPNHPGGARQMVVRSVRHPGTQPNDYIERADRLWRSGFEQAGSRLALNWAAEIK